ncbi:MAG: hypothetical protein QM679_00100 [Patulibacter sp.]
MSPSLAAMFARASALALPCSVALALPATQAIAADEIGKKSGVSYAGMHAVDTQARLVLFADTFDNGAKCSAHAMVEYKPVLHARRYEHNTTLFPYEMSTISYAWTRDGSDGDVGDTSSSTYYDANTGKTYGPTEEGYRLETGLGQWGGVVSPPCPTDPTIGGTYTLQRMVGWVSDSYAAPTPTPEPTPTPTPTLESTPTPTTLESTPTPTADPTPTPTTQALELLPPPLGALARLQSSAPTVKGGATSITVTRDGKQYRADTTSAFQFGDVIEIDEDTLLTIEYLTGGRVGLAHGAKVRITGDREMELLGGTTEAAPSYDYLHPLEIQTNGGVVGIRG